jgi:cytosine deaminase
MEIPAEALRQLEARITRLAADPAMPDDPYIILTLQEALAALHEGNAAIGAILVDGAGQVVQVGRNRMFYPRFRSDLHAEMDVLTAFEEWAEAGQTLKGYTLYSSLEPCEMCMIRLINSGVSRVYFAASDEKAKTTRRQEWAPHWQRLGEKQEFAPARCSPEMRELGWQVFVMAAPRTTEKLLARR